MSSADNGGPQPTAHKVEPGCTLALDRRDFMKTTAGAAAAIAAAGASTGTVAADDREYGVVDGILSAIVGAASGGQLEYNGNNTHTGAFQGATSYDSLESSINRDPSSDAAILWNLSNTERTTLENHNGIFHNRLNDAEPVANLAARHGIALAYEDGRSASVGYDYAQQRIRQHYEIPEFNHIHVTNKSLAQLGFIADAAMPLLEDGEVYENSTGYIVSGVDDHDDVNQLRLIGDREEVEWELHDGTAVSNVHPDEDESVLGDHEDAALRVPMVEANEVADGEIIETHYSFPAISPDLFENWDEDAGTTTVEFDDGTSIDWNWSFTNLSHADSESESIRVFEGNTFAELLDRIHEQSDRVVGNYDVSFVEDLYGELDAGHITTDQVRSPEGMVHFLSGTDDPSHPRFRMAMLQQLGMAQPDFSMVSGMTANYTGATAEWVDTDPDLDERHAYPDEFVEDETYSGVLFADGSEDIAAGNRYAVGQTLYVADNSNNVRAIDAVNGTLRWVFSGHSDYVRMEISPDGSTLYTAGNDDGDVYAVDTTDGSIKWEYSHIDRVLELTASSDAVYFRRQFEGLQKLDADDGTEEWLDTNNDEANDLQFTPDQEILYQTGDGLEALDPEDGDDIWSDSTGNEYGLAVTSEAVYYNNGGEYRKFDHEGNPQWTADVPEDIRHAAASEQHNAVFLGDNFDPDVIALDASDGSELWSKNFGEGDISEMEVAAGGGYVYVAIDDSKVVALDPEDGSELWTYDDVSDVYGLSARRPEQPPDGTLGPSVMFDEDSGSSGEQVNLQNGFVEVTEMYDAGGAEIEHVDHNTIDDLEEVTGEDIDTIIDEMDEFDDESDIQYTRDVLAILEHYEVDDAEVGNDDEDDVTINDPEWSPPEYETTDSEEFVEELNRIEEYLIAIEEEEDDEDDDDDDGWGFGFPSFPDGEVPELLGVGIIGLVVLAVIGIVTDLVPGLGN